MINLDSLKNANLFTMPFHFGLVERPFQSRDDSERLVNEFPSDGFDRREYGKGRFFRRPLIVKGENAIHSPESLTSAHRQLGEQFLSTAYRDAVMKATNIPLDRAVVEAWFWKYDEHTEFVPHLDDATKLVTQVFYLTPGWTSAKGGLLRILHSETPDDIAYSIAPRVDLSTLIIRSETSWHYITPITPDLGFQRDSITVHFHHP